MKANQLDSKVRELLQKRGYRTDKEIEEFLNPDESVLNDPFDLANMAAATERINKAIALKEKVVIYGDYDCDGISACVILYKFFQTRGLTCDVYIPSRFDDGYGLSFDMIDQVLENSKPDLIITVDLGVTACKEVEKIKAAGVDIIVTDHHEPSSSLPDCLLIDPKIEGQAYPFNGLCGAGVALKLVEALSSRQEAMKYFDICAIATIGDIVPLVDENRFIAKAGIEMINEGKCLKSYKYMLSDLKISKLKSADVTFKLVPRLNASGRMSSGKKVFDFLIEKEPQKLKTLYESMIEDNDIRLSSISQGVTILEEQMQKVDLQQENIIMLCGDFHQGVLGILASRICHDYNRPAIVFTTTEDGTLKGSGRSLDDIDLHAALMEAEPLLVRFGGHKMAVGVEVQKQNFEKLKEHLTRAISRQTSMKAFAVHEEYDIEISEEDINEKFINMLEMLEPFGCKNERPVLMMPAGALKVNQMRDASFRHFKITTKSGKSMVAFSADRHIDALKSDIKKHLIVDLENNYYKGKTYPQAILKDVFIKEVKLKENKEREAIVSLVNSFYSEKGDRAGVTYYDLSELKDIITSSSKNGFGTIVVVDSKKEADRLAKMNLADFAISHIPLKNRQNTLLVSSRGVLAPSEVAGYNTIIFTRQIYPHEKAGFSARKVYAPKTFSFAHYKLDKSRQANVFNYNSIKQYGEAIRANNIFEWLDKMKVAEGGLDKVGLLFSLLSFCELGFVELSLAPELSIKVLPSPPKRELSSSKFMNRLAK